MPLNTVRRSDLGDGGAMYVILFVLRYYILIL